MDFCINEVGMILFKTKLKNSIRRFTSVKRSLLVKLGCSLLEVIAKNEGFKTDWAKYALWRLKWGFTAKKGGPTEIEKTMNF